MKRRILKKETIEQDIPLKLFEDSAKDLMQYTEEAFKSRRSFLISALEGRLKPLMEIRTNHEVKEDGGSWIGIESLSRLRKVVGGRFQNIKSKWTDAGFPLREHRGDKWKDFKLNEQAWIELSNWVLKQGFENRLTPNNPDYLFEIRGIDRTS